VGDPERSAEEERYGVSVAVINAVVDSFYPDAVRVGSQARLRAQAAQSVATVFAAGVVASLTLTDIKHQLPVVRIASCIAILGWVVAAFLYMRAVGRPVLPDSQLRGVDDGDRLVQIVLDRAKAERDRVDKWQGGANLASVLALVMTALAFAGAAWLPDAKDMKPAAVTLAPDQQRLLPSGCSSLAPVVEGTIDANSLDKDFVDFTLNCGKTKQQLRLPKKDLKGIRGG
jgi:hypothetical protein